MAEIKKDFRQDVEIDIQQNRTLLNQAVEVLKKDALGTDEIIILRGLVAGALKSCDRFHKTVQYYAGQ